MSAATQTIVTTLESGIDFFTLPRRGYDFNAGDRRFADLFEAIEHADAEALRTGIRQCVRPDSSPDFVQLYLVQAVGS